MVNLKHIKLRCKQFNVSALTESQNGNHVMSLTVAYNDTDRTFGRHHSIRDFSIYFDNGNDIYIITI